MSHNENFPEKSARNHRPAIIAILAALAVALMAFLWFGADDERGEVDAAGPVPAEVTSGTVSDATVSPPGTPGGEDSAVTTPATDTAPATTTPPATSTGPATN